MEQESNLRLLKMPKGLIILSAISILIFILGAIFGIEALILIHTPNKGMEGLAIIGLLPIFLICAVISIILSLIGTIKSKKSLINYNRNASIFCLILNILILVLNICMIVALWL